MAECDVDGCDRRTRHHRDGQDLRSHGDGLRRRGDRAGARRRRAGQGRTSTGCSINGNLSPEMNPNLQLTLGFEDLTLLNVMNAYGSTPATMLQYAFTAIDQGQANVVVLLYADAPLQPATSAGASYAHPPGPVRHGRRCSTPTASTAPTPATPWRPRRHMEHVRHDQRAARRDRRVAAAMGDEQRTGADPQAAHAGGASGVALHRRAAAPLRLLPRVQRRDRVRRHVSRAAPDRCASRPCTCSVSDRRRRATASARDRHPGDAHRRHGSRASMALGRGRRRAWPTSTCSSCTTATRTPSS